MNVIESFNLGKHPDPGKCEDFITLNNHFAAVIDGATDKSGWSLKGRLGGRVAGEILSTAVLDLHPEVTSEDAIRLLTESVKAITGGDRNGPSASIAIYSRFHQEMWQVGDVSFATISSEGELRAPSSKPLDIAAANVRSAFMHALIHQGVTMETLQETDPGRAVILPLLQRQFALQNKTGEWSFGSLDGQKVPLEHLKVTKVDANVHELVMYSDGYPNAYRNLAEAEKQLARLLFEDPLCFKVLMGTKGVQLGNVSFDDRAYLRIAIS